MKTKKSGVFAALAAVLLLGAVLITNCTDTVNPGGLTVSKGKTDFKPPEGKSTIRLNLGSSIGRTIMPGTVVSDFNGFVLNIANTAAGSTDKPADNEFYANSALLLADEIEVTLGETYAVQLDAYMNYTDGTADPISATGNSATPVTIVSGENEVAIVLKGKTTGSIKGTFAWDLKYNNANNFTALGTATLDITTLGGTAEGAQIDLKTTPNAVGTRNLDPGYYYVIVSLAQTGRAPVVFTDMVHIYQEMTSTFTKNFTTLVALPSYKITFNNSDGSGDSTSEGVDYMHGETLNAASNYTSVGLPTSENTNFMGWYTATNGGGTKVQLNSKVYQTRTLYGNWFIAPYITLSVSFDISDPAETLSVTGIPTQISHASLNSASGVSITATLPATATFVSWKIGGQTYSTNPVAIGYYLTPLIADALGAPDIEITLVVTIGGVSYTKQFTIANPKT